MCYIGSKMIYCGRASHLGLVRFFPYFTTVRGERLTPTLTHVGRNQRT
jgi:hypothetical protein